jgi:hypothetical protein
LPESKRFTEYWLRRASTDSIDLFQKVVDDELDGHEKASSGRERVVSIDIKGPKSRRDVIKAGLKDYAKSVGVEGDESRALELMVQEHTGSEHLISSIRFALRKIAEIKKLNKSDRSATEILEMAYETLDEVVEHFRKALEGLQNLESNGKGK